MRERDDRERGSRSRESPRLETSAQRVRGACSPSHGGYERCRDDCSVPLLELTVILVSQCPHPIVFRSPRECSWKGGRYPYSFCLSFRCGVLLDRVEAASRAVLHPYVFRKKNHKKKHEEISSIKITKKVQHCLPPQASSAVLTPGRRRE